MRLRVADKEAKRKTVKEGSIGGAQAKCEGRMIVEGEGGRDGGGNKGGEFVVGVKGRQDKKRARKTEKQPFC